MLRSCLCFGLAPAGAGQVQRTVQPLFEEPEEEEMASSTGTLVGGVKSKKPHPQTAVPGKSVTKKSKVRSKQPLTGFGELAFSKL